MILSPLKRLFRVQEATLLLSLTALACLPLALSNLVRDAALSMLLPITALGWLIARGLSTSNARKIPAGIILLGLGPLALIIRIGGMWNSLFEVLQGSFTLVPSLFKLVYFRTAVDLSSLLMAQEGLIRTSLGFGNRFAFWFSGFLHGVQIDDPVVRTLIWCLVLWLVAVWAGWQMARHHRLFAGMAPSTLLLAFVIDYTGREIEILWLNLGLLLFLLGLTNFATQKERWDLSKTDYSDSTSLDTLGFVGALTLGLVTFSFLASTVSVGDILENLRERRARSTEAQGESLGLEAVQEDASIAGVGSGLPRSHLIKAGPDLSRQPVMTISTGELPPLPERAQAPVPRHYWRTLTYQIYSGTGWENPSAFGEDIAPGEMLIEGVPSNYRALIQSVTFSNEAGGRLYWAGTLMNADVPFKAAWLRKAERDPLLYSNMLAALTSTKSYQAESLVLKTDTKALRDSPAAYPEWVRRQFLALPDSVPARVLGLARDLTASEATPYDRALAIQNYMRTFPYTLEVGAPPPGREVADYFLFDLKKGYCDYYATTMVVLARAAGLPTRLVVGYVNGSYDSEHAQYVVTENYAHSWVEVYFTNIGWVEFEPTAGQPEIIYEGQSQPEPAARQTQTGGSVNSQLKSIIGRVKLRIPASILFGLLAAWTAWDSLHLILSNPSRVIQILFKRLRRLARPISGIAPVDQTAHRYASTLAARLSTFEGAPRLRAWLSPSGAEIEQLTDLYSRSLFAPGAPSRADARAAAKAWSRLRWRLLLAALIARSRI